MLIKKYGFKLVFAPVSLILLSLGLVLPSLAQSQAAADNSGNNSVQSHSQTADQQPNNVSDRQLTAKIRRAVIADKSLSTYGHNVKIIVAGGTVTLKGPVHSEDEKQKIAAEAVAIAGEGKVTNQITVKQ